MDLAKFLLSRMGSRRKRGVLLGPVPTDPPYGAYRTYRSHTHAGGSSGSPDTRLRIPSTLGSSVTTLGHYVIIMAPRSRPVNGHVLFLVSLPPDHPSISGSIIETQSHSIVSLLRCALQYRTSRLGRLSSPELPFTLIAIPRSYPHQDVQRRSLRIWKVRLPMSCFSFSFSMFHCFPLFFYLYFVYCFGN